MMALLFSAPAVLIIAATILVPFGLAVFLSLHSWNLKRPGRERFIGLENYADWLTDSDFWDVSPHRGGGSVEGGHSN